MIIKVRLGTRDDIDALVEVNCSAVETWHHFSIKGRGDTASYNELSPWERTMHGGPWMDHSALARYWDDIDQLGIVPLVAEFDRRVVGHLDLIFSDEQPLGDFLYLDVLMIHKAYRRKGAATALVKEAEKLAENRKVGLMLVRPEQYEGPSGLTYRSCGFEKAFDVYEMETTISRAEIESKVQTMSIPRTQKAPIKTHIMICGWISISRKTWYYTVNPNLDDLYRFSASDLTLSAKIATRTYFLRVQQNFFNHTKGALFLWAPLPLDGKELRATFRASKSAARWLGIRTLTTRTIERYVSMLEKQGFRKGSKTDTYLAKKLSHGDPKPSFNRRETKPLRMTAEFEESPFY